jgi:hypothetical protein
MPFAASETKNAAASAPTVADTPPDSSKAFVFSRKAPATSPAASVCS